jgi:hypothetical protein
MLGIVKTESLDDHNDGAASDGSKLRAHWVAKIRAINRKGIANFIEQGQALIAAKKALDQHGQWLPMIENDLPYGVKVAEQLMRIARDPKTSNSSNWTILPPVLSTLVEITKLSAEEFERRKKDGTLYQGMTCKEVSGRITPPTPAPRETLLAEFKSFVEELKQSLVAGDIKADDIRLVINELKALL